MSDARFPNVEVVYFDLGGTLLHPVSVGRVYAEVGRKYGVHLGEEEARARFVRAFRAQEEKDREAGWKTGKEREQSRWREIVAQVLGEVRDFEACFAELYAFYARPGGWLLDPEAPGLLAELKRRGFRLGVASNYDERVFGLVAGMEGLQEVSLFVVSSEVGHRKPSAEFFRAMEEKAEVGRERVLLVGDDLGSDYEGALAFGMGAVLLDAGGRYVGGGVRRVRGLREVLEVVGERAERMP